MKDKLIWCNTKEKLAKVIAKLKEDGYSVPDVDFAWISYGDEVTLRANEQYKNVAFGSRSWYKENGYGDPDMTADKFLSKSKNPSIVIFRRDRNVIAKNVATGDEGVAKCSPNDEFCFKTGAAIAMARLMAKTPEVLTDDVKAEWKKVLGIKDSEKKVYTDPDRNFKAGDRVVVRDWDDMKKTGVSDRGGNIFDRKYDGCFTTAMKHICGKKVTVIEVDSDNHNCFRIATTIDGVTKKWWVRTWMIERLVQKPTPKFKVDDLVTLKSDAKSGEMYDGVILIDVMIEKLKCKSSAVAEVHVKDDLITYTLKNGYIYSESMLEKCEEGKIYEGDKVRIKKGCTGMRYDLHYDWVKEYISDPDLLLAFEREKYIETSLDYEVVKIAPHGVQSKTLAYIKYEGDFRTLCYLFDIEALEKV